MSRISQLFLSLIIMSAFVLAQNTGTNRTSDPGAVGQPSASQTDPSVNGNTTSQPNAQPKKKHKKKKNQDNMSTDPSGNMNNGATMGNGSNSGTTSQGTGTQPQDPGTAPNTPNDQAPQSTPSQTPPQTTPPQQ